METDAPFLDRVDPFDGGQVDAVDASCRSASRNEAHLFWRDGGFGLGILLLRTTMADSTI
jgi:hypothetical protein